MNKQMNLKPFFSYYGGKYRLAPKYPEPKHDTIIEPFAGSAGYAVRHYEKNVELYDLNPKIVGVWSFLIKASVKDLESLPDNVRHISEVNVCEEAKWLIGFWLNKATTSPAKQMSKWVEIRPNSHWGPVIKQRIVSQSPYIKHWKIKQDSYSNIDNKLATWFVDPPYASPSGKHYPFNKIDYGHLSKWSEERQGQVMVCEMKGADWMDFQPFAVAKSMEGSRGKKTCEEMIWYKE